MPVIFTRPSGAVQTKRETFDASEINNDSIVSGSSVKDALETLSNGSHIFDRMVFNHLLTVSDGVVNYTLPSAPITGTVQVFINGLLQEPGIGKDYIVSGSIITFLQELELDDIVLVHYIEK